MRKRFAVLILLPFSFVWIGFGSNASAGNNQFAAPTPTPKLDAAVVDVEDVFLDSELVLASCIGSNSLDNSGVKIWTLAKNDRQNRSTYYYTVSGGQIVGHGINVFWDLKGAKSGEHTVTVGVGKDFVIQGNSITKTIRLGCHTSVSPGPPCECPAINVLGPPKSVDSGDSIIFIADVRGGETKKITYDWSISGGTIVAGQGTPQIMVKTATGADSVTATIRIGGTIPECNCPTLMSQTVTVTGEKP